MAISKLLVSPFLEFFTDSLQPERKAGSDDFEQLNPASQSLYASAILLPTALELLTIEDSKKDAKSIAQRAKEEADDVEESVILSKMHELAAAELQEAHWVASLVAQRDMHKARKA